MSPTPRWSGASIPKDDDQLELVAAYQSGMERGRLFQGSSRIEFERTKRLLLRHLPPAPASVLDVGGGPGSYASWLAGLGYQVHLVDLTPAHVEQALEQAAAGPAFTAAVGDATALAEADSSFDAVLLLGPLYHLLERSDRVRALSEAARVVRPDGIVAAAVISRFASLLDGLRQGYLKDPVFRAMVEQALADGRHRNPTGRPEYFTTAYFHHPGELEPEMTAAGLRVEGVFGVEGPGSAMPFAWDDEELRPHLLWAAEQIEREPALAGLSDHLLGIARRPA